MFMYVYAVGLLTVGFLLGYGCCTLESYSKAYAKAAKEDEEHEVFKKKIVEKISRKNF